MALAPKHDSGMPSLRADLRRAGAPRGVRVRRLRKPLLLAVVMAASVTLGTVIALAMLKGNGDARPAVDPAPQATWRATEQSHARMVAALSEEHRRLADEIDALERRRAGLDAELAAMAQRRETEADALAELQRRRVDATERLTVVQNAVTMENERLAALQRERSAGVPPSAAPASRRPVTLGPAASPERAPPPRGESRAGAPAETASLPAPAPPRIFVHYSTFDPRGPDVADRVARRLTAQGYTVPEIRPMQLPLDTPSVRYFFPEDRGATTGIGATVAAALGLEADAVRARDFTTLARKPQQGTLEVWLPMTPPP